MLLSLRRDYREQIDVDCIRYYGAPFLETLHRYGVLMTAALIRYLPEDSATMRSINQRWSISDHLLAAIYDQLSAANWQRSADGQKNRRRPKPIPRPGVEDKDKKKFGTTVVSLEEAKHRFRRG